MIDSRAHHRDSDLLAWAGPGMGQVLLVNKSSRSDSKAQTLMRTTNMLILKFWGEPESPGEHEEMQALGPHFQRCFIKRRGIRLRHLTNAGACWSR